MYVDFSWFQQNQWVAAWGTFFDTLALECTILYFIYTFLGGLTFEQRKNLRWRLISLGSLSAADRAKREVEEEQ